LFNELMQILFGVNFNSNRRIRGSFPDFSDRERCREPWPNAVFAGHGFCSVDLDLDNTIYALDSTTIDLCLTLFPWADFRSTKSAVKMHTLLDLRGPIPSFIHVSNGKMADALALDLITPEAGAICAWSTARNCSSRPVGAFLDGDDSFSMPASSRACLHSPGP
jgi:hypothetical protein